jgi:hypothetical protein
MEEKHHVHVTNGVATSISTDGTTALLVFTAATGGEFRLSLPTEALSALRTMCGDLARQARLREVGAGYVAPRHPAAYSIGHSDQMRGMVAILLDPDTPDEAVYVFKDDVALNFAAAIRQDVLARTPPTERGKLMNGIAMPPHVGRLILPGK